MDVSVIIVNYNVAHFLLQCVDAVKKASTTINTEIFVVDNNSSDNSIELLQSTFRDVTVIANKENVGFGAANNQALKLAKGEYTLFLNPDTIIAEDTLIKCIAHLKQRNDECGLGVKMIDGSGKFLPESKRSFPTLEVAFYKLFGLSSLFPKHKKFSKYHLGYFSENENHEVDVLSGAFLMAKTSLLKEKGGFDEDFFMYGEDIDLSFRLQEDGCNNSYFAGTQIIHYKGESTKTQSLNYTRRFYEAMIIFAKKHLKSSQEKLFTGIMRVAIYARGILSFLWASLNKASLVIFDLIFSFIALVLAKEFWEYVNPKILEYNSDIFFFNFPIYLIIFLATMFFSGAYDRPFQSTKIIRGGLLSMILIAIAYAFFPEQYRFSRIFLLVSAFFVTGFYMLIRMFISYKETGQFSLYGSLKKYVILVGDQDSQKLLNTSYFPAPRHSYLGLVSTEDNTLFTEIGKFNNLKQIVENIKPTDIIFDTSVLTYKQIIESFEALAPFHIRFHTSHKNGQILISSHSKYEKGRVFTADEDFNITRRDEIRKKRLFDILSSVFGIVFFPIIVFTQKKPIQFIQNCFLVLFGSKTWVGYQQEQLPVLKNSVLKVGNSTNENISHQLAKNYAKHYSVYEDLDYILRNFSQLGS